MKDAPRIRTATYAASPKYDELLNAYKTMARDGYATRRGGRVEGGYARQEALRFRHELKALFTRHEVRSVLDYGGGAGEWTEKTTPEGPSLADYAGVREYRVFEPALNRDDRRPADAVVCFDVMEHVFIADIPFVLTDIMGCAARLVVFNIACYPADALLPGGENAHCTLRSPDCQRGAVDMAAAAHPDLVVALFLSARYGAVHSARAFRFADIIAAPGFAR